MAKKEVGRTRDAAGIGPYARERANLVPMSRMKGWKVQSGEADIRSWEVRTVSGKVLGAVRELLIDPKAGEVVLIDVDLAGSDRHAFVPLRVVEVDRAHRVVRADSADLQEDDADRTRLTPEELSTVRDKGMTPRGDLYDEIEEQDEAARLADRPADRPGERVVERRPIVEETVVRRRELADPDADAESRL